MYKGLNGYDPQNPPTTVGVDGSFDSGPRPTNIDGFQVPQGPDIPRAPKAPVVCGTPPVDTAEEAQEPPPPPASPPPKRPTPPTPPPAKADEKVDVKAWIEWAKTASYEEIKQAILDGKVPEEVFKNQQFMTIIQDKKEAYEARVQMVSGFLKSDHDIRMNIIRNMFA